MRILLAEDDERLGDVVARGLRKQAYAVDVVTDGARALIEAAVVDYDAIVLDVMLPSKSGFEVARAIRLRSNHVPILMLTARDAVSDRVEGLDSGADDYLVKPFAFEELLARLRALMRRGEVLQSATINVGDLVIDTRRMSASRNGRSIDLTTKEYALLEYLARNEGATVSREDITTHVWDANHDPCSNALEVLVARVRKKVDDGHASVLIQTRRGAGYSLASAGRANGRRTDSATNV
ncbi:MAG TPA: response regulator transcription factor [Gemmatimonadaceae bacterium]|jgi:two-component system copper resistance phosphate regulon response regulator CusR